MRFFDRDGAVIRSLDDWKRLGKPASESHWKPGRSAYELAHDWIDRDAADAVCALLSRCLDFAGLRLTTGVAEKQTRFDEDSRRSRNHDLLVGGTTNAGPLTIGVEGKADALERFLERLIGVDVERTSTADGWITAPVELASDGVWSLSQTRVSFAKLIRDRRGRNGPRDRAHDHSDGGFRQHTQRSPAG
jgi:hypothetical protein